MSTAEWKASRHSSSTGHCSQTRDGRTMRLHSRNNTSSTLRFGFGWVPVRVRRVSLVWFCQSLLCRVPIPTCAFFSLCPLVLVGVAVRSIALAITAQVVRGRGCSGGFALEFAAARVCREQEHESQRTSFFRDTDVMAVLALDARRIEVIAEGFPAFRHHPGLWLSR